MPKNPARDPLTAATTSVLLPALRPIGFSRKSNLLVVRVRHGILQLLDLQKTSFGGGDFCINYASVCLFIPREHVVLQPGGRLLKARFDLRRGRHVGPEVWLGSQTHQVAAQSMQQMVALIKQQAVPFFERTKSPARLLKFLETENWGARHHQRFEQACCHARLGHLYQASQRAAEAIQLYEEDGRSWCANRIHLCQELQRAVAAKDVERLLDRWTETSVENLGLSPKIMQP